MSESKAIKVAHGIAQRKSELVELCSLLGIDYEQRLDAATRLVEGSMKHRNCSALLAAKDLAEAFESAGNSVTVSFLLVAAAAIIEDAPK